MLLIQSAGILNLSEVSKACQYQKCQQANSLLLPPHIYIYIYIIYFKNQYLICMCYIQGQQVWKKSAHIGDILLNSN